MTGICFYCSGDAPDKCPDCNLINFCSSDHLAHHKVDELCQPYVVHFGGEDVGRFLRATRDIKPFEIIVVDQVKALGIFDDTKPICLTCFERIGENSSLCPFCRMPMCNDPKCLDSEQHKPECKVLRRHGPEPISVSEDDVNPVYSLIGPLRLLRWKKTEPTIWKDILGLASHIEERRKEIRWEFWVLNRIIPVARACGFSDAELEDVELLFAVARTNALSLYKASGGESPGYALCPIFSLLNHSCMANCRYDMSKDNSHVTVRAARPILSGEELTIQYKDPLVGNVVSAHSFKNHWMFTCRCPRCSDPTELGSFLSAMRCQSDDCDSGFLLPTDSLDPDSDWICTKSGQDHLQVKAESIREAVERLKFQVDKLTYKDSVEDWEKLLERLLETLHPNHFLVMNAKRMLIQLYGTQVKFDDMNEETIKRVNRKLDLCQEYLKVHEKLDAGYSKWRGRIMEEMSTPFIISRLDKYKKGEIDKTTYMKSYMEGIRMLKEAARCRQYDPRDDTDSLFGLYLRNFNDAIEKFSS